MSLQKRKEKKRKVLGKRERKGKDLIEVLRYHVRKFRKERSRKERG
jgi:hypothetical protein